LDYFSRGVSSSFAFVIEMNADVDSHYWPQITIPLKYVTFSARMLGLHSAKSQMQSLALMSSYGTVPSPYSTDTGHMAYGRVLFCVTLGISIMATLKRGTAPGATTVENGVAKGNSDVEAHELENPTLP
jgi:hypothetical protein